MIVLKCFYMIALISGFLFASSTTLSLKGKIIEGESGINDVTVSLVSEPNITTTTDSNGDFELTGTITHTIVPYGISIKSINNVNMRGNSLNFSLASRAVDGSITFFSGNGQKAAHIVLENLDRGNHKVVLPALSPGFYIMRLEIDQFATTRKLIHTGMEIHMNGTKEIFTTRGTVQMSKQAATAVDSLTVQKSGYQSKTVPISSYQQEGIEIVIVKEGEVECSKFEIPSVSELTANPALPDPFKFIDGTRISKKADWPCLREQLQALLGYSHGDLPEDPGEVSASYSGGTLNIEVTVNGKTEGFNVSIRNVPSGEGPHPAIITLGGAMGIRIPSGVAEISYPHNTVAQEKSRSGVFSKLYGSNTTAGSMVMWAWGVGRLIDALEQTTGHKIDPTRLGVTGCSRNGKGAMVCGAYEKRIALVLPVEGGSGGISSWRIAKVENNNKGAHPDGCQTASQIIGESGWLSPQFDQFGKETVPLDKLPVDAHTLAVICAPRGLYMIEGSQNSWNCNAANWTAAYAAQMVYEALGVKNNIGHVMTNHSHCMGYSSAEQEAMQAFCDKFLLNKEGADTEGYFYNDGSFDDLLDYDKWIDWEMPTLE